MQQLNKALAIFLTGVLASCGGGSSGGSGSGAPATSLSIKGTAAKGAALASAVVEAKCNGGTGTATTAADGTYTINLTTGSLPCMLKVTTAAGDLYSVATGSGTTVTANITPITQLIVATLIGKDPATYFSSFTVSDATALTAAAVDAAQATVVNMLNSNGVDTAAAGNLLTGNLVAANGSTTGNALDQALDALNTKLTSAGLTLTQLSTMVQQISASTPATSSGTPSVAADVALQPAAATCAALHSGTYRLIVPQVGTAGSFGAQSTEKVTINASTLVVTFSDGSSFTMTPMAGSPCRFTNVTPNGTDDIVVSQAGVIAFKSTKSSTAGRMGIGFPEQLIPLADLAGDWNQLGYEHSNGTDPLAPTSLTATISSTGKVAFTSFCVDAKTCTTTGLPSPTLTVNSAGGYDVNFSATEKSRLFAFRAGGGELIFVGTGEDGTFGVGTRVRSNSLPTAGAVNLGWSVATYTTLLNGVYQPAAYDVGDYSNTVDTVDTTNSSFTRTNVVNFLTNPVVTQPETLSVNKVAGAARNGYNYRVSATVTRSNGAVKDVPEFIQLPLRGMGLSAVAYPAPPTAPPAQTQFVFSVAKP